jgi:hypothetical protein
VNTLLEKLDLYRDEMALFVLDEFNMHVIPSSIGKALKSRGWTKKTIRRIAKGRNANLRDLYMYKSWDSGFCSYHYVSVNVRGQVGENAEAWAQIKLLRNT